MQDIKYLVECFMTIQSYLKPFNIIKQRVANIILDYDRAYTVLFEGKGKHERYRIKLVIDGDKVYCVTAKCTFVNQMFSIEPEDLNGYFIHKAPEPQI